LLPGIDLWDHWPVQELDGSVAQIAGGALMMMLSAPEQPDPDARHAIARIRLMHRTPSGWDRSRPPFARRALPGQS
jgi:levansucrase